MKLTVKPLKQKDAGRGLAAIDQQDMQQLGVDNGDYVTLMGGPSTETVARVWSGYPEDDSGIIRIDGHLRQEAGVGIDDEITVEQASVPVAASIDVALPESVEIRGDIRPHIRDKLSGHAVTEGEQLSISLGLGAGNQTLSVTIVSTDPGDPAVVTDDTNVTISDQPAEQVSAASGSEDNTSTGVPDVAYEDIGGIDKELDRVREMVELPMRHPELFHRIGIEPPKGVLLHGPPGTGKTLLAKAVANEVDAHFLNISGPEIMGSLFGESEERLREIFEEAQENEPAIIFIDEIDSIAADREDADGDVERRVVAQLLSLMDGLDDRGNVSVLAATNRVDAIDPALRRGGRFDRELEIGVPDKDGRKEILDVHTREMPLEEGVDLTHFAENTHGFVGADLEGLAKEAAMNALRRARPKLSLDGETIDANIINSIHVTERDFKEALKEVKPSAFREVFVEVPDVEWDDVGGLEATKSRLQETIQWPLDYPTMFDELNMNASKGVLLYGPPGTGKTLMAKAVANESNSNFISVKGPELLSKWVGESEEGVREVFEKARENAPTIIFFDEIDAIATERGRHSDGGAAVTERVVSQLLTELDGLEELEDVTVIAATNRPELIDDALLRPGRFDRHIYVPLPEYEARREIFEVHTRGRPLASDVDLDWLAEQTEGYVGADIEALCGEATMVAAREFVGHVPPEEVENSADNVRITREHFDRALDMVAPSVDDKSLAQYDEFNDQYAMNDRHQRRGSDDSATGPTNRDDPFP